MSLTHDATIRDVLPTLEKPEDYLCEVLQHLMECKRAHENARVSIGVTGTGKTPYHKVTYTMLDEPEQTFGAYDRGHRITGVILRQNTWSTAVSTIDEVQMLLRDVRSIRTRPDHAGRSQRT